MPSYFYLSESDWAERISAAWAMAAPCTLCPRRCGVDRRAGRRGVCRAGNEMTISSIFAHHGEEPPLSGTNGSGTVFFTWCTLRCVFCQNWQLSHEGEGKSYSPEELSERMLWLQEQGCHNINLVTPTQFLPWILEAIRLATAQGLELPIVYNCGGYELPAALRLLAGIVDIYLPDMKYSQERPASRFSRAGDYAAVNREAIREMFRQVGPLRLDGNGIATRGLCIRHLVLPGGLAGSEKTVDFLTDRYDPEDITISLMAQYHPSYRAAQYPEISRRVTPLEYEPVRQAFLDAGFPGYYQEPEGMDTAFLIDFKKRKNQPLTGE
jgi:putative pyruvate formate lyase activating enzyme